MEYSVHFAPLQGYTDAVYREAHARVFGGVETYYTPFVRLEKGEFRSKELRDITVSDEMKDRTIPQLIASTPDELRLIASLFRDKGYDRADINLGCPFPMQVRQHKGAGILPYPDEATGLLRTIEEFPELSFSVKMRVGWDCAEEAVNLLPLLNALPLIHLTLHPRLGVWQYKGEADASLFAPFYSGCRHPLYYNGDIQATSDIHRITSRFPELKGIMMGRGLLARPWIAAEYVSGKEMGITEKREHLLSFHSFLLEGYRSRLEGGDHQILDKMKTLWDYLLPEAEKKLRKKVLKSNTLVAYSQAAKELISEINVVV